MGKRKSLGLRVTILYDDGSGVVPNAKIMVAYKKNGKIVEQYLTSKSNGSIDVYVQPKNFIPPYTFFHMDGGVAYPIKVEPPNRKSYLLGYKPKNRVQFLLVYEYLVESSSSNKEYIAKGDVLKELEYRVLRKSDGEVVQQGKTNEWGKTAPFSGLINTKYQIQIKPKGSKKYITPKIRSKYQRYQSTTVTCKGKDAFFAVCPETYVGFKVVNNKGHGIANAKVWLVDKKGNKKGAVRTTNKNGIIAPFVQNYSRRVKVSIQNCEVSLKEKEIIVPKIDGQNPYHVIEIKTVTCSTVPSASANKTAVAAIAAKTKLPLVYDLENQELIVLKPTDYKQFEEIATELTHLINKTSKLREDYAAALALHKTQDRTLDQIKTIEDNLKLSEDKVKKHLNSNYKKTADLKEVFLIERYIGSNTKGNTRLVRAYLRRDRYLNYRHNRINKSDYKIKIKGPSGIDISTSPKSIKLKDLKDSVKSISVSKSFKKETQTYIKDFDVLRDGMIKSVNELSRCLYESKHFKADAEAQWMRAVAGASANGSASWNPSKGDIGLKGGFDVNGKMVLCEGNINTKLALPSLNGWRMASNFESAGEIDLGAIRFVLSCNFYGFMGAKVGIAGAASIKLDHGVQRLDAARKEPSDTIANMWDKVKHRPKFVTERSYERTEVLQKNSNAGVDIGVTAFAGAEVGITPAGSIEWLSPIAKDFRAFAKISATIAGSAGIGAKGSFYVFYSSGKFKIRVLAALCLGLGGKGAVEYEVDSGLILEFTRWLSYQLLYAGFRTLVFIHKEAFANLSQLSVMILGTNSDVTKSLNNISKEFRLFLTYIDTDKARLKLAQRIINKRDDDWLKYATPEAKGMLLYQLTRHGKVSHLADPPDSSMRTLTDLDIDYLDYRKQAIIIIFTTVTTSREWQNVLQHMTIQGEKGNLGKNEGDVIRLLNYGKYLADEVAILDLINSNSSFKPNTGSYYVDKYLEMRQKVKPSYPKGIEVVKNTDPRYDIYTNLEDYTSPSFYAASNPNYFDSAIYDDISNVTPNNDDDSYLA